MNVSSVSTSGLCPALQDVGHCGTAAVQHKTRRTLQRVELMVQNIIFIFYIHNASPSSVSHKGHYMYGSFGQVMLLAFYWVLCGSFSERETLCYMGDIEPLSKARGLFEHSLELNELHKISSAKYYCTHLHNICLINLY